MSARKFIAAFAVFAALAGPVRAETITGGSGGGGGSFSGTAPSFTATNPTSGSVTAGPFAYGVLPYADTGIVASWNVNVNSFIQTIISNPNAGTAASAGYVVSNDQGTASTNYGEWGMNSSGFSGPGIFNLPGAVYGAATSVDLSLGTTGANAVHIGANSPANGSSAIEISSANAPTINGGALVGTALGTPPSGNLASATGYLAANVASGTLPAGVTINNANWSGTVLSAANGGTNCSAASITCFNNITGLTASGTTGTTSTNLVFSTSPTFITPVLGAASLTSAQFNGSLLITDAANVINQRNGTTAQGMRQFLTYTDASNGTWGYGCDWTVTANVCTMGYSGNGTGAVTGRAIIFSTNTLPDVLDFNYNETGAWSTQRSFVAGNTNVALTTGDGVVVANGSKIGFASSGAVHATTTNDTYFTRGAIAGAMNANGTLSTAGYTVAGLPAGVTGKMAYVTDQLTSCPVLSGTFTGGGSVVCRAFYNGTSWVHE